MSDPAYRTKPQIALALVTQAVADELPFRAVVAGSFSGETDTFRTGLHALGVGDVLARRPSHAWWAPAGTINSRLPGARSAGWDGVEAPGDWQPVLRTFREGHTEPWWALEISSGPYGPAKRQRAVIATTDPATLPEHRTWYLVTNLPALHTTEEREETRPIADLAEVVRLSGLRNWLEQSDKQVKGALGWRAYQVRSDRAMRRHWALVCCAFSVCWWANDRNPAVIAPVPRPPLCPTTADQPAARGKKDAVRGATTGVVAGGAAAGAGVAGTLGHAAALRAGVVRAAPTARQRLLDRLARGWPLPRYDRS